MPRDVLTPVVRNDDLGQGNFLVEFRDPFLARETAPAQFFMIGIPGSDTLLRRPYSVCGLPGTFPGRDPDTLQVLYKVYGRGTSLLASLKTGSPLRVLGPLGRGFQPPTDPAVVPVFVAGGIGSAPFPAWATRLAPDHPRPRMLYGARGAGDLPLLEWFSEHTEPLVVTTEDGSRGRKGRITEPLGELLESVDPAGLHLYACGPEPMLRAVRSLALAHGAACDLALEAHMACGFGVCLGCVVPVLGEDGTTHYERVCVEGPVMPAARVAW